MKEFVKALKAHLICQGFDDFEDGPTTMDVLIAIDAFVQSWPSSFERPANHPTEISMKHTIDTSPAALRALADNQDLTTSIWTGMAESTLRAVADEKEAQDGMGKRPMVSTWQPIETAPKDGTGVIGMYVHIETQVVHNIFWVPFDEDFPENPEGWWTYTHSEVSRELLSDWRAPTHWMPLPGGPKT